jgi:hypothetical protein
MSARPTTPPAAPPAIAAVFDELDLEEVPVTTEVEAPAAGRVVDAVVCATEEETTLPPITEPASTSGESEMKDTGWLRGKH